ncbi:MAG: molecular chaperone TorD family protein [Thermodesulfovibrionales bacterium]
MERSNLYKLFAALFADEPSGELIDQVREIFHLQTQDTAEEIVFDFTALFLGPGKHLPPYESVYNYPIGEISRLWGRATEEVQAFYLSVGLAIDEEVNLIPDHLSAELLFMAWLIDNGLEEQEERFLVEHLLKWVPEYCDQVRSRAQTGFYRDVADLLKEFILSEYEEIS